MNLKRPIQLKINKQISAIGLNSQIKHRKDDQEIKSGLTKQLGSPSDVQSPTRRKKNSLISFQQKKQVEYQTVHHELNSYIDELDVKVTKLMQNQEAQFLIAYRNHTKKVNQEMEEIKNKALLNANTSMSQTEKIQSLEKQLVLFREQSLKLFERVYQKQKIIYHLNNKVSQLQSQKSFLQSSLKSLTRRNKQLQGIKNDNQFRKYETVQTIENKQFLITRPPRHQSSTQELYNLDFHHTGNSFKSRPFTTAINSKGQSFKVHNKSMPFSMNQKFHSHEFNEQKQKLIDKIDILLKDQVDQEIILNLKTSILDIIRPKQHIQPSRNISTFHETESIKLNQESLGARRTLSKRSKNHFQSKMNARKSELEEYFYKSIETVRKQIIRRRGIKAINFYSQYSQLGLSQFKTIDYFRLLELLLSHDKIVESVHNSIFELNKQYKAKKSPEKA